MTFWRSFLIHCKSYSRVWNDILTSQSFYLNNSNTQFRDKYSKPQQRLPLVRFRTLQSKYQITSVNPVRAMSGLVSCEQRKDKLILPWLKGFYYLIKSMRWFWKTCRVYVSTCSINLVDLNLKMNKFKLKRIFLTLKRQLSHW